MGEVSRYSVVAIQTANPNGRDKQTVRRNLQRNIALIETAITGYSFTGFPLKLFAFPELTVHGIPYMTAKEALDSGACVTIPGEETDRLVEVAKENDIYIETGSFLEYDPKWPSHVFNTACIIGPKGIEAKYRKVQTWVPLDFWTSPHSLEGYDEELFPVADLPIGKLAVGICYDFIFPELLREYTMKGAEVLIRASAYMPPWGPESPTNWWTIISQVRSLENVAYGVHVNQGASLRDVPPFAWPGGTCIVDYEGRVQTQTQQVGEQLVLGHIDLDRLREWRANTYTHLMPAHLRSEAYTYLSKPRFPARTFAKDQLVTTDELARQIDAARERVYGEIATRYKREP
ncbi:MAG: nitrilase [Chloroflexi bacterium]|nr:nitrilase [Chloroflexota bacterium]